MKVITEQKVPIKLWVTDLEEGALEQAKNLANLPFAVSHVALMPDAHQGYGMPIGGVLATKNCVWLLQKRYIPFCDPNLEYDDEGNRLNLEAYDEFAPENIPDEACWNTEAVFLTRHEAYETAKRREYNYGKQDIDWRIYGVPCHGMITEKLASTGVNQEFIDGEVEKYNEIRKEWEEDKVKE